jgi:hypothetical protein
MYSYELDEHFHSCNFYFDSFYEFEKVRCVSPQVLYNLLDIKDGIIRLHVFTTDGYDWTIYIKKEGIQR